MHTREFIFALQRELSEVCPDAIILLGGSYLYGDATEKSDIDFYCITSLWRFSFCRKKIREVKAQHANVTFNCLILTKLLFDCGYYYIYGQKIDGEVLAARYNQKQAVFTSLKFAQYFYIKSRCHPQVENFHRKCLQKIAITKFCLRYSGKETVALTKIALRPFYPESNADLENVLNNLYSECQPFFSFNFLNYYVYNIKFLRKGIWLFLFGNPDTIITRKMLEAIRQNNYSSNLEVWLDKFIFPAIIE